MRALFWATVCMLAFLSTQCKRSKKTDLAPDKETLKMYKEVSKKAQKKRSSEKEPADYRRELKRGR